MVALQVEGQVFARGDEGYEEARQGSVWHARVPERYPDLIVHAVGEADVIAAVRHAAAASLRIGVRSGGHSWSANHLRDGGMLLDVSRLDAVEIDAASMTATAGPGRSGHELCEMLEERGLFFPSGHCRGVGLGGYLLQGGYGWNSRAVGLACESVLGVDVVTADGELRHANAEQDSELYWSARGAGPGFFGVVTRFHLRLRPMPAVCGASMYIYPTEVLDEFFTWVWSIGRDVSRKVEMQVLLSKAFPNVGVEQPAMALGSPVFAESEEAAQDAVAIFESCPVREQAILAAPYLPMTLSAWYDLVMQSFPSPEMRFGTDNMWTAAAIEEVLPGLRQIVETMPPHPTHVLFLNWGDRPERPDMANCVEAPFYLALYGQWPDERDDERYGGWASEQVRSMEHLSAGIQLADENLGERWDRFATDEAMQRLDRARAHYDPHGFFHQYMGRPDS